MAKLKPCPFCGSTDVVGHYFGWDDPDKAFGGSIECTSCGGGMANDKFTNTDMVEGAWNKRTSN